MSAHERGSEVVQFVMAAPLLLLVLFSIMQVGGMMLATSQVSSEITRACRQLDVGGLARAVDKEAFVKEGILGASTQLKPENLQVEDVRSIRTLQRSEGLMGGAGPTEQRTFQTTFSCDVRYLVPSILDGFGLMERRLSRHVECACIDGRAIEVSLEVL